MNSVTKLKTSTNGKVMGKDEQVTVMWGDLEEGRQDICVESGWEDETATLISFFIMRK